MGKNHEKIAIIFAFLKKTTKMTKTVPHFVTGLSKNMKNTTDNIFVSFCQKCSHLGTLLFLGAYRQNWKNIKYNYLKTNRSRDLKLKTDLWKNESPKGQSKCTFRHCSPKSFDQLSKALRNHSFLIVNIFMNKRIQYFKRNNFLEVLT